MNNALMKSVGLLFLVLAFGLAHCGDAECGGTETGNPTTCTSNGVQASGEDAGSTTEDEDAGSTTEDSDNDLSAELSMNDPFLETLAHGHYHDNSIAAATLIFDNEGDFAAFWEEFFGADVAIPEIDFSTHIVAAAIMGTQSNGGYALAFTARRGVNETLILTLTETRPGQNCMVTHAPANPYHIVSVPISGEDMAIETESVETDC